MKLYYDLFHFKHYLLYVYVVFVVYVIHIAVFLSFMSFVLLFFTVHCRFFLVVFNRLLIFSVIFQ